MTEGVITRFPGGVSDAGVVRKRVRQSVTGKATIAIAEVDKVTAASVSLEKVQAGAGKTFTASATPSATPGAVDVQVLDIAGTESTTAVFVVVDASGPVAE